MQILRSRKEAQALEEKFGPAYRSTNKTPGSDFSWSCVARPGLICDTHATLSGKVLCTLLWFGEFMGTLVLILLGNGVNAGVTLRKSYAADAGWIVVATGWAIAVLCGVLTAQAFGSPGANLNPAITLSTASLQRQLLAVALPLVRADAGRHLRRNPDGTALCTPLVNHSRPGSQTRRLLHQWCSPSSHLQLRRRSHRHHGARHRRRRHLLPRRLQQLDPPPAWGSGSSAAWCGVSAFR